MQLHNVAAEKVSESKMYEYKCELDRVVDGDTVDVDIDLGFGVWLKKERVRVMGIDTPESRTSDKIEKVFGKAASARLKELIEGLEELHSKIGEEGTTPENIDLSFDSFHRLIEKNLVLISQEFSQKLVVPEFLDFCTHLKDIYRRCRNNHKVG